MKYIALIPSYEPTEKLIKIIDELYESKKFEIVLVNDGSSKEYDKIFKKCEKKAKYLSYDVNQGKGFALKTGFEYINNNYKDGIVITMDSDGQHTVKDAINLCNIVSKKENTILLGKRIRSGKTPLRSRLGNAITRFFYRITTGIDVYDTQTGLRAFQIDLIPFLLKVDGNRFEYEMNMLLDAPKNKIKLEEEVIETIYEDNNSGSHFNALKDSYLIYKELLKFVLSSVLSFVLDFSLFTLFNVLIKNNIVINSVLTIKSHLLANVLARLISGTFNYEFNKNVVFKDDKDYKKSVFKYILLATVILVLNTTLLTLAVDYIGINKYLSKVIIEVILFIVSYRVQKIHIF